VKVVEQEEGVYEDTGYVYQRYSPLARSVEGGYAVIGSWVVDDQPAGIGVRESAGRITGNTSRFVPHKFD
jgi:glutathionylspermidine synthase